MARILEKRLPRVNEEVAPQKKAGAAQTFRREHPAREHVLLTVLGLRQITPTNAELRAPGSRCRGATRTGRVAESAVASGPSGSRGRHLRPLASSRVAPAKYRSTFKALSIQHRNTIRYRNGDGPLQNGR